MSHERFASVWDAFEDTPQEAESLRLRVGLMRALNAHLTRTGFTQAQAAEQLGVTQPRISDLRHGKFRLFSLDTLVNMAASAGLHVDMQLRRVA